jgi:hypothetical protein
MFLNTIFIDIHILFYFPLFIEQSCHYFCRIAPADIPDNERAPDGRELLITLVRDGRDQLRSAHLPSRQ